MNTKHQAVITSICNYVIHNASLFCLTCMFFLLIVAVSTVGVDAVLDQRVTLPCDIEPTSREDRVYMVLWFRNNTGKPLYR
jgi:hypothetical protein